jgi:glutathione synthase/RimK-type ligase-like ATP-grasp enzyme
MLVGLIKDKYWDKNDYLNRYKKVLDHNNVKNIILDVDQEDFWEIIRASNLIIFRWGHYDSDRQIAQTILPVIENHLEIKCFPDQATCWHFDDKIKQYYLMQAYGFPFIKSEIAWSKKRAFNIIQNTELPTVFKLKGGAGAKNVQLIKNKKPALKKLKKAFGRGIKPNEIDRNKIRFVAELRHLGAKLYRRLKGIDLNDNWNVEKNYFMFQKFLPKNQFDIRITTIGKRAFGFRRLNRENDFRASGSGNIEYNHNEIDLRCISMALKISEKLEFQSMAYDFLMNENNEPEFCEISYTFDDRAIYKCEGFWNEKLEFTKGNYWPQYLQLIDMLGEDQIKEQPIIEFNDAI